MARQLPDLVSLRAVSNGALKGDKLPSRIKIFNWGDNPSTKGNFKVGQHTADQLAANQRSHGFERVALDYNHCSVPTSPDFKPGRIPKIFGYGRPNVIPGDGVYLEEMEWTPLAAKKAKQFEDLSPAASVQDGEIDFIHSVALTTNGCLHDVTFFSANTNPSTHMSEATKNVITLAMLAGAMGLAATATEAEVTGKLKKLSALEPLETLIKEGKVVVLSAADLTPLADRLKKVEEAGTKNVALLSATVDGKVINFTATDVVKLAARLEKIEGDLKTGIEAAHAAEAGRVITLLSSEGKAPVNPDTDKPYTTDELQKLSLPVLKMLRANTPATVPLSARTRTATEGTGIDPNLKGRARFIAAQEMANAGR